jgi:hypothetical protein
MKEAFNNRAKVRRFAAGTCGDKSPLAPYPKRYIYLEIE